MAAVLVLQVLHDYSDRETAEAVKFDVRWKVAIGASLDDPRFDPSSLVYCRNRIARSERPPLVEVAAAGLAGATALLSDARRRHTRGTFPSFRLQCRNVKSHLTL